MHRVFFIGLTTSLLPAGLLAADLNFRGPHAIGNVPRPVVTVHSGDFNKDGKVDLVASNGSNTTTVMFQDPSDRTKWTLTPLRVGSSAFFARGADFDGDGTDDLMVCDGASTMLYLRSVGDGTFEKAQALTQSRGARWVALGDWNHDGRIDCASSNLNSGTLTIFVNEEAPEGKITFRQTQNPPSGREHTVEALDYDADGNLDLALGQGLPGIQLHKGQGDGKFVVRPNVTNLGCVEYIAVGDLDADGKGDLAPTCIDDANAYIGLSMGDGRFKQALRFPFATGTESTAVDDFNKDGIDDLALVSQGSGLMKIILAKGNGTFDTARDFGPTGSSPVFLIARDLDGDGNSDVISADSASSTCTVFYGRNDESLFESSSSVSGFGSAREAAVQDFDKDGRPDFILVSATLPKAFIYLKPGGRTPTKADYEPVLPTKYSALTVADFDGDQVLDLAGVNTAEDRMVITFLNADGTAKPASTSLATSEAPVEIEAGFLDPGPTLDLVCTCSTLSVISLFAGKGDGTFNDAIHVQTTDKPKRAVLADVDGDGKQDIVVQAIRLLAIHYGLGDGSFEPFVVVPEEATRSFTDVVVADMDGDGRQDLLAGETRTLSALIYYGRGARQLQTPPFAHKLGVAPQGVEPLDVDGDQYLDLTAATSSGQGVAISRFRGAEGYEPANVYRMGVPVTSHVVMDLDGDQILDLGGFSSASITIRLGFTVGPPAPKTFRRGDADGNGVVQINDPVTVLNTLFREGFTIACEDGADADDSGVLNLTDAVLTLNWLFLEGEPPAAPGPLQCGEDLTADERAECQARCVD